MKENETEFLLRWKKGICSHLVPSKLSYVSQQGALQCNLPGNLKNSPKNAGKFGKVTSNLDPPALGHNRKIRGSKVCSKGRPALSKHFRPWGPDDLCLSHWARWCSRKAAMDNMWANGHGCVPITLWILQSEFHIIFMCHKLFSPL